MFLKLYATYSNIRYGKMYFNYFSKETKAALQKINGPRLPYNNKEFWAYHSRPNDFNTLMGNYVEVGVKVIKYRFVDKTTAEIIEGYKFYVAYLSPAKF